MGSVPSVPVAIRAIGWVCAWQVGASSGVGDLIVEGGGDGGQGCILQREPNLGQGPDRSPLSPGGLRPPTSALGLRSLPWAPPAAHEAQSFPLLASLAQ